MKKIAVFTGTRAEYGLLYWLMKDIQGDESLELQLIVSGAHLSPEFGQTVNAIEQDGFKIAAKVEMLLSSDTSVGVAKSMGLGVIGFADALDRIQPDCLVLLGDRFEALAIAQTAMVMQIPIAHIHGGELTEGAVDEAIRHAITKLSHLHFTSTEVYRRRVIQLGEQPANVVNVGAPGLESLRRLKLLDPAELEAILDFELGEKPIVVTYHPVTLTKDGGVASLNNLLRALTEFNKEARIVITYPNADAHGRELIPILEDYAKNNANRVLLTKSLGVVKYLSLMKMCGAVVGNSSSGLLEAPALKVPTLNIGIRQQGRIKPSSVIDCDEDESSIRAGLKAVFSGEHQEKCFKSNNPYGDGFVAEKIIRVLKLREKDKVLVKHFNDLNLSESLH